MMKHGAVKRYSSDKEIDIYAGDILLNLLHQRGWSIKVFASKIGMRASYISRYFYGHRSIPSTRLQAFADVFSMSLSEFCEKLYPNGVVIESVVLPQKKEGMTMMELLEAEGLSEAQRDSIYFLNNYYVILNRRINER